MFALKGISCGLLLLLCVVLHTQAVEVPNHIKAQAKKLHNRCVKETGVDEALITRARTGDMSTDQTFKCFLHCIFNIVGLMDSDNTIHLEHLVEILPEELRDKVLNLANTCGTKTGADNCDTAFQTAKCYFETDPEFVKNSVDALMP